MKKIFKFTKRAILFLLKASVLKALFVVPMNLSTSDASGSALFCGEKIIQEIVIPNSESPFEDRPKTFYPEREYELKI